VIIIITSLAVGIVQVVLLMGFCKYRGSNKKYEDRKALVDNWKWCYVAYLLSLGNALAFFIGSTKFSSSYILSGERTYFISQAG